MDSNAALGSTDCMAPAQTAAASDGSLKECGWNRGRPEAADPALVVVQAEWDGWRTALVLLADLEDVQWLQPSGAPHPVIHAYVSCTNLRSGDLQHECDRTSAPHQLLVCVLKSHVTPSVFEELARRASERGAGGA